MKYNKLKIVLPIIFAGLLLCSCEKKDIDIDLTTSDWKVDKIRKSGKLISESTDSTYILEFTGAETYNLALDVNACIGLYEIPHKGRIEFQPMACTEICCDSDFAMDLAALFPKMTVYYIMDNRLHLEGEGEIILQPL